MLSGNNWQMWLEKLYGIVTKSSQWREQSV